MAVDRKVKQKKKREEKKKVRQQQQQRISQQEKLEEYEWYAGDAYEHGDCLEAMGYAQKVLKRDPSNLAMWKIAVNCSIKLDNEPALYPTLVHGYRTGKLDHKFQYYILGKQAVNHKNYEMGKEVLEILLAVPSSLKGALSQDIRKHAQEHLAICKKNLDKAASQPAPRVPRGTPPGKKATGKPVPASTSPTDSSAARKGSASDGAVRAVASRAGADESSEKSRVLREGVELPPWSVSGAVPELQIVFQRDDGLFLDTVQSGRKSERDALDLAVKAYRLSFRTSYDQLICLPSLRQVESLWYQQETARKVMKNFRGRAILADEVGLGKTIEAGLILKEYILRGLVRSALILTPSSLVHQWQEELESKFCVTFVSSNDPMFRQDPDRFWQEPFILASIHTAKSKRHFDAVTSRSYDLVIVDEAHHLKNRTTLNWKLVNSVRKTFLLMLTATPVQNNLEELYNLVTLLKPGHLKTLKAFKEEFVTRGNPTDPRNREKLRQLLKEVMVRNTRSVAQVHLPPRMAYTVRVAPASEEQSFYDLVSRFVTDQNAAESPDLPKMTVRKFLEAAGSSHVAALRMLEKIQVDGRKASGKQVKEMIDLGRAIPVGGKIQKVMDLVKASGDQKIIFVNYIATLEYLKQVLEKQGVPHVVFQGGLTSVQKQGVMDRFREGCQVLLATGTGGEGFNLQFCHTLINYDLPWNPMEIEQRIGRIHRIGQEREVRVYNFCATGSLEEYILDVLDRKINMFELVVGEMDMILGRLQGEEEFSDLVYEIWVQHGEEDERRRAFDNLGSRLQKARSAYEKSKELDEKLFREDFGV